MDIGTEIVLDVDGIGEVVTVQEAELLQEYDDGTASWSVGFVDVYGSYGTVVVSLWEGGIMSQSSINHM
jgi:hypothetical protein